MIRPLVLVLGGAALYLFGGGGCSLGQEVPLGGITPEGSSGGATGGAEGMGGMPPLFEFEGATEVIELNSELGDANPTLSFDLLSICFTSLRAGGTGDEDIWCSRRDTMADDFQPAVEAASLNTPLFETSSALSPDGLTIWFGSRRAGGPGEVDVYSATRPSYGEPFGEPALVDELNSAADDIPRPLGFGGRLMPLGSRRMNDTYLTYMAEWDADSSTFLAPELITELADTARQVVDAFLLEDGLTMLFTQDDPGGEAGDLYFVQRTSIDEPFGVPQPIVGINTEFNERDPWLSPDQQVLYFASDRNGNSDIFVATRVVR